MKEQNSMHVSRKFTRRTLLLLAALPLCARDKKRRQPEAVIFGTVFQESGLSLPGANILVYNEASPKKKYRAATNYRGEYRVRVPAGEATYVVAASARKFEKGRRTVKVYDLEQATANIVLKPKK